MASSIAEIIIMKFPHLPVLCSKIKTTMINTSTREPRKMYSSSLLDKEMQFTGRKPKVTSWSKYVKGNGRWLY